MAELNKLTKVLADAVDNIREGVQLIDKEGRYLYVNKSAAVQGNKDQPELMGRTVRESYPGIEKTGMYAKLMEVFETGKKYELLNDFKYPGSSKWYQLVFVPTVAGVLILSSDVTELNEQTERLIRKTKLLEEAIQLISQGKVDAIELDQQLKKLR